MQHLCVVFVFSWKLGVTGEREKKIGAEEGAKMGSDRLKIDV